MIAVSKGYVFDNMRIDTLQRPVKRAFITLPSVQHSKIVITAMYT
jgi:hypothetical protein